MALMNKVFFDANILLSLLLVRNNYDAIVNFQIQCTNSQIYISALTGHLVAHFRPEGISLETIELFLKDYQMIELKPDDFTWAFDSVRDNDFEDALQLAVAIRTGCDTFVTFDKQLAKNYDNLPTLKMKLLS